MKKFKWNLKAILVKERVSVSSFADTVGLSPDWLSYINNNLTKSMSAEIAYKCLDGLADLGLQLRIEDLVEIVDADE